MIKVLSISGSPIKKGSTEILLEQVGRGLAESATEPVTIEFIRLNDYRFLWCQACGKSPEPDYCFYHDALYPLYDKLINGDVVLFGSPIYFDSVSAQAKAFIDRCNCLRPLDFEKTSGHHFKPILTRKRLGGIVLVGGERGEYECGRKVIAGFFKWVEIDNCGLVVYRGSAEDEIGTVQNDSEKLKEALALGKEIGMRLKAG